MGKVLVFIFDGMTDYETTLISHLLCADAGKEVIPIAYNDKLIKGRSGFIYKPEKVISDILTDDVEGLIISGGWFKEIKEEFIDLINDLNSKIYLKMKRIEKTLLILLKDYNFYFRNSLRSFFP